MYSLLLKKAVPFALTFVLGSLVGGLSRPRGAASVVWTWPDGATPGLGREGPFGYGGGRSCPARARSRALVSETKPLVILFKPDARMPPARDDYGHRAPRSALVRVTFGADGQVQAVEPFYEYAWGINRLPLGPDWREHWESVERAARLIQFTPEMRDGVPVTVTRELEIFFFNG